MIPLLPSSTAGSPASNKSGSTLVLALLNNTLELHRVNLNAETASETSSVSKMSVIEMHGHRWRIRVVGNAYDMQLGRMCGKSPSPLMGTGSPRARRRGRRYTFYELQ